jgi:hypothetical protein
MSLSTASPFTALKNHPREWLTFWRKIYLITNPDYPLSRLWILDLFSFFCFLFSAQA